MQKAISIVLSILLLASSTSVTYAKHFCGDYEVLSTITLGKKDLTCGMSVKADDCDDNELKSSQCCKNKYENVDTDDNYSLTSFDVQINIPFIACFVSVFVLQQVDDDSRSIHFYANYDPPPIDKDIPVLYQVFII
ncbi:MAG: hypothetical protein DRI95_15815 [Bacteroidetes bacterium]|nr:MAG: hypothetical protein DRI95_15815 [Bacteroidota bacterium]